MAIDCVSLAGPPLVMIQMMSKTLNASIVRSTRTMRSVGVRSGRTT